MTPSELEPDDRAFDAMLESIARASAPRDLAARVSAALDTSNASPVPGQRVRFVMAAAGMVAIVVGGVWITSRHPASAPTPVLSSASTPSSPAHASPAPEVVPQSTTPETAALALAPVRAIRSNQPRSPSQEDDHDRALPALDALPAVRQPNIAPTSLETTSIDIDRLNAIAPLTVQGGRDTSGRGDF
jgi:hypothetical protein